MFQFVRHPNSGPDLEHHRHLPAGLHGDQPQHPGLGGAGDSLGRGHCGLQGYVQKSDGRGQLSRSVNIFLGKIQKCP